MKRGKWPVLLLGSARPHLKGLILKELSVAYYAAQLGSDSLVTSNNRVVVGCYESIVVICNYKISPITADTIPNAATRLYYVCRSCFGPAGISCRVRSTRLEIPSALRSSCNERRRATQVQSDYAILPCPLGLWKTKGFAVHSEFVNSPCTIVWPHKQILVEPPGTAPGSTPLIPQARLAS